MDLNKLLDRSIENIIKMPALLLFDLLRLMTIVLVCNLRNLVRMRERWRKGTTFTGPNLALFATSLLWTTIHIAPSTHPLSIDFGLLTAIGLSVVGMEGWKKLLPALVGAYITFLVLLFGAVILSRIISSDERRRKRTCELFQYALAGLMAYIPIGALGFMKIGDESSIHFFLAILSFAMFLRASLMILALVPRNIEVSLLLPAGLIWSAIVAGDAGRLTLLTLMKSPEPNFYFKDSCEIVDGQLRAYGSITNLSDQSVIFTPEESMGLEVKDLFGQVLSSQKIKNVRSWFILIPNETHWWRSGEEINPINPNAFSCDVQYYSSPKPLRF